MSVSQQVARSLEHVTYQIKLRDPTKSDHKKLENPVTKVSREGCWGAGPNKFRQKKILHSTL